MIAKTTLNNKAVQKLATEKPGINHATKRTSPALIIKVKRPSVRIVIGKVKIIKIGRRIALTTPRAKATRSAVVKLAM